VLPLDILSSMKISQKGENLPQACIQSWHTHNNTDTLTGWVQDADVSAAQREADSSLEGSVASACQDTRSRWVSAAAPGVSTVAASRAAPGPRLVAGTQVAQGTALSLEHHAGRGRDGGLLVRHRSGRHGSASASGAAPLAVQELLASRSPLAGFDRLGVQDSTLFSSQGQPISRPVTKAGHESQRSQTGIPAAQAAAFASGCSTRSCVSRPSAFIERRRQSVPWAPGELLPPKESNVLAVGVAGLPPAMKHSLWSLADDFQLDEEPILHEGYASVVAAATCRHSGLPVVLKVETLYTGFFLGIHQHA
jgi:hypothetical protein